MNIARLAMVSVVDHVRVGIAKQGTVIIRILGEMTLCRISLRRCSQYMGPKILEVPALTHGCEREILNAISSETLLATCE